MTTTRRACPFFTFALFMLTLLASSAAEPSPAAKPDVWTPWRFFVGQWEGDSKGQPGVGKSERSYAWVLNNRYMVSNKSVYPLWRKR